MALIIIHDYRGKSISYTKTKLLLLTSISLFYFPQEAYAQIIEDNIEEAAQATANLRTNYPALSGEVVMELQNEYTLNSDDPTADEHNNLFFRTEVAPTLQLNEYLFIDGVGVFENIQDREPNENNFFDNEGAFIEELKLNFEKDSYYAFAGKYNPAFGIAWDFGRGIWGEDFAEDYEITERIGLGGGYILNTPNFGTHAITASTFFADTTILSQSKITNRDDLSKSDGGISNTESFESFAISIDGESLANVDGLYYKLAYQNQAEGDADAGADRQTGYAATLGHVMPITERVTLDGLIEYADINNVDGADVDNTYITTSLITTIDDTWNITASYTGRDIDTVGGDTNDHLFQLSGGYDFGQGTTAEIGYRYSEEAGVNTDIIGGLVRHSFAF